MRFVRLFKCSCYWCILMVANCGLLFFFKFILLIFFSVCASVNSNYRRLLIGTLKYATARLLLRLLWPWETKLTTAFYTPNSNDFPMRERASVNSNYRRLLIGTLKYATARLLLRLLWPWETKLTTAFYTPNSNDFPMRERPLRVFYRISCTWPYVDMVMQVISWQ